MQYNVNCAFEVHQSRGGDCRKENFLPLKHLAALGKDMSTMTWKPHITWKILTSAILQFGMHES